MTKRVDRWSRLREALRHRTGEYAEQDKRRREIEAERRAEQAALDAAIKSVPFSVREAAKAWYRGDAVYVYEVNRRLSATRREQAATNATVNAIVALGWQLQGTATRGGGSLLVGNSIVFTFVRPPTTTGTKPTDSPSAPPG